MLKVVLSLRRKGAKRGERKFAFLCLKTNRKTPKSKIWQKAALRSDSHFRIADCQNVDKHLYPLLYHSYPRLTARPELGDYLGLGRVRLCRFIKVSLISDVCLH
jgi:hypothetical protein